MFSFQLRDHSHKDARIALCCYPFLKLEEEIEVCYFDHKLFLSFRPVDSYDIPKREEESSGLHSSDRCVEHLIVIWLE